MLGKIERTGKFGKSSLVILRNLSCPVIWIEFRNYLQLKNTRFDSGPSSFKSSTC